MNNSNDDAPLRAAVVIPARLQSKRLPGKLLLAETGKPLVSYTIERALEAKRDSGGAITRVLVATDSEEIAKAAVGSGAEGVLTRPDHRTGTDRIAEAASALEEEFIVNVQGSEVEMDPELILRGARMLAHEPFDMGTFAYPIADEATFKDPNTVKVVLDSEDCALYFSRAPVPFARDGRSAGETWGLGHYGLYVYRREFLLGYPSLPSSPLEETERLEQLRALAAGVRIKVEVVSPPTGREIETPEDYAEFVKRMKSTREAREGSARSGR